MMLLEGGYVKICQNLGSVLWVTTDKKSLNISLKNGGQHEIWLTVHKLHDVLHDVDHVTPGACICSNVGEIHSYKEIRYLRGGNWKINDEKNLPPSFEQF